MKKTITLLCLTATLLFCFRTTCTAGSWSPIAPPSGANDIYCVAYGNNCFIAVDCDYGSTISKIYKSTDYGQTWTTKATINGTTIYTVAYVNGKFIATDGNSGNGFYSTDDGNTWTQCQIAEGSAMYGITYGSSGYAAVRTEGNGSSDIYKSSDGISWTKTLNVATGNLANIGYGNNTYVAVGSIGNLLYTSSDANNWTTRTNPSSEYFQGIAYGNGTFVAVASNGTIIRSTDNGVSWASVPSGTSYDINAVAYGNGYFYAVGNGGTIIKSADGSSWSAETSPAAHPLWGIAYGNGYFVATGESGEITVINIPSKPTVTTTAPSTVTSTSATLGGNVTEDGSLTVGERGIVYSLSSANTNPQIGGAGVTKVAYATGGTGSYSQTINPLSQGTPYYYNAYATNTQGTSYGDPQTFTINTISSITRSNPATTNASSVSWAVTFAGPVTSLTSSNFSLANTSLTSPSITNITGSGTTWTVTASTGTGNGSLGLNFANNTGTSAVFTNTLPFAGDVYTIDKTSPTVISVSSSTANGSYKAGNVIAITVTFSESVNVTGTPKLALNSGATASYSSGSNSNVLTFNYSVASGENSSNLDYSSTSSLSLNGGAISDAAGNAATLTLPTVGGASSLGGQKNIIIDNVAPTATISSTASEPTNISPIPVTITFSEPVTGFDASDITVGNGTKGTLSGSGATYTIDITPSGQGTVTVNIAAGVATDAAGNSNTAATQLSRTFDNLSPTVTLSSTTSEPTNASPIPVTITFSESVTGFNASDITVTNGTKGSLSGSGSSYSIDVTPSGQGAVTVNIAAGVATDAAGNSNTAATQLSRTFDNIAPTVTLSSTTSEPTNVSPIPVTITFSESVTGFDASDITVTNGTKGSLSGSGSSYSIDVTPSGQGAVTVNVAAGVATDAAGNSNTAATQLSRTFDNISPAVTLSSTTSEPTNVSPIPVTITFSEPVTGFDASDIIVTNGTKGTLSSSSSSSYSINITPSGQGTVSVDLAAGVATDLAGNSNTAATQLSRTFDNIAPTVSLSSAASDPTSISPIPVTISFSESVTGFDASDITVGNGTKGTLSGSGSNYSININPSGQGIVTVDIAAGIAIDAANNLNTAATQLTRSYITVPDAPTIGTTTGGDALANVSFTAPTANGGSAITGYTVTSSPGGFTGSGTSSPITVNGLTNGTAYTFTVTATNSVGTSAASIASNSVTPKGNQTITFSNPGTQLFGTTPTLNATATSGLTVTFTTSTPDICSITSTGELTFIKTGTCTILADQAGNTPYNAAPQVAQSFAVDAVIPGTPTIGTTTAGDTQANVNFTAPTANGGSAITGYTVTSNPGGFTGTGASSPITVTGLTNGTAYTFTVTATNSAGTSAASIASNSVTPKGNQTITFSNPGTQLFGTTPTLNATATSGLTVTFTTSTPDICSITSTGELTFIKTGTCTILADQAGNVLYNAAPQVAQSFAVDAVIPGAPTIGTTTAGDTQASVSFTAPTSNGGSAITGYTVTSSPGGFTSVGTSSPITVTGLTNGTAYTFTVTATNSAGTSIPSTTSNSVIPNISQTITFANPGVQTFGTSPTLAATATSGLAVTFTTSTPDVCSITSTGELTFKKAGICTILVDQAGNAAYTAAPQVSQSFTVNAIISGAPTIGTATSGNTQASVSFTAPTFTGGSAITGYTAISSPGGFTGTGTSSPIIVTGLTNGTAYTFTVTATNSAGTSTTSSTSNSVTPKTSQTITFNSLTSKTYGDIAYTLNATSSSGLTISYSSDNTAVANVSGTTLTIVGAGTANITASQTGNAVYEAATNITQQLIINKKTLTVTATADTKPYDGTTVSTSVPTVGTLAPGDAINAAPTQSYDNASVGTTHVLTASGLTIKNGTTDATGYYDISYATATGTISAKPLTISAPTVTLNKIYDGSTTAAVTAGILSGVLPGDAGNVAVTASASYADATIGTNKTITVVYTLGGSAAGNYSAPANFVTSGAEISSGVITLQPLSNPTPSTTGTDLVLSYNVVAGGPTQYKITFEAAALAVGIQNVSYTALATTGTNGNITIVIPKGTRPGHYKGSLQMKNDFGVESTTYDFVMTVNIPTEYIAVKYNRVLVLDNSTRMFSAYQWFKDGVAIDGATKQFYSDPKGLVGTYTVQATTTDGEILYSYPKVLNIPLIKKVTAYPTMVRANQTCTVEITDDAMELDLKDAELSVYSSQGIRVYYSTKVEKLNTIKLPAMDGTYSGRVTTTDGQSFLFKVIVAN